MDLESVIVIDTETSLHNHEIGKFKAHPISPNNWIVWLGAQALNPATLETLSTPVTIRYVDKDNVDFGVYFDPDKTILVGHNIGYDLLFLANPNNKSYQQWRDYLNHPGCLIWDTQLAAYRLSGHTHISPSMDKVAEQYGLQLKPGNMKDYWNNGISTEDIPNAEVQPYLEHDVNTTSEIMRRQIIQAAEAGMLDMLRIEMQSRVTTILMELNGMCFDDATAVAERDAVIVPMRMAAEQASIEKGMALTGLPKDAVRPNSPHFLKAMLYAKTPVKWKERRAIMDDDGNPVCFKGGKRKGEIKQRWENLEHMMPGPLSPVIFPGTDEETLTKIREHNKCSDELRAFLDDVISFRDGMKQEGNYYTGYSELTWYDGMIHGNLNHAITSTGRLSSTNPNLQNAGHSPIRNHFKSRFADGKLMEVDLSQIEVVVQAYLSQDSNMIHDIEHGTDFHCKRAAFAHHELYQTVKDICDDNTHPDHKKWTKIRKGAKIVSFQKAYGAGVNKIADTTGLTKSEVKAFMLAEDTNYPKVPETQAAWIREVERSTGFRDKRVCGILTNPIGVQYRFYQEDFNGHKTYKPTCIKNYPIQGFSADILKIILAGLRKVIHEFNALQQGGRHDVLIVNTVHDSVIFDVPPGVDVKMLGRLLRDHFVQYPIDVLKNTWGIDFNCPISADVDIGDDWNHMETISLT